MLNLLILNSIILFVLSAQLDDCIQWAKEGECVKNPRYIWAHCAENCMDIVTDDNDQCKLWASQGECSKNPAFVQVHCPQSCGYSINWNPFTRRSLHIEFPSYSSHDLTSLESNCYYITNQNYYEGVNGLYIAAITMHHRIINIVRYGSYRGFSQSSPSEFLLAYGIIEGMLYTFHLYELVANASIQSRPSYFNSPSGVQQNLLVTHLKPIKQALSSLFTSLSYDADQISRIVFPSLELLENAKNHLNLILNQTTIEYGGNNDVCLSAIGNLDHNLTTSLPMYLPSRHSSLDINQPITSLYTLTNGVQMPTMGLGTWQLVGEECEKAVYEAIEVGYRHIDTAQAYSNEKEVGKAIIKSISNGLVERSELFIATKLSFDIHSKEEMIKVLQDQLSALQVSYIDLYYLHSPIQSEEILAIVWSILTDYYHQGIIKSLGISNFDQREIQYLYRVINSTPYSSSSSAGQSIVTPHVLQNKYDIYHSGRQLDRTGQDIEKIAKSYGLQIVGYSPFSSFPFSLLPLDDPILLQMTISKETKTEYRTVSDIIIQWMLQRGVAVIPRSSNRYNLERNLMATQSPAERNGFALTAQEMKTISSISHLLNSPFFKKLHE